MIYFDSSALIKLIAPEPESEALSEWVLRYRDVPRVTSAVSKLDVLRSFREMGPAAEDLASIVVSKIEQLPVRQEVLDSASELDALLGPVEAIHLASASRSRDGLHAFVSYDPVMLSEAHRAGLTTASPGAEVTPV